MMHNSRFAGERQFNNQEQLVKYGLVWTNMVKYGQV